MKVCQVGYGHLGKWHAEKANKVYGSSFHSIIEVDKSKHEEISNKYPNLIVSDKIEDVLQSVKAVIIVTPTIFHFEIIKKALRNGLHVFCEKPLTNNYLECLRNWK